MITRHFLDIGSRRVHYRKAGTGPALLLAHQSPRSSAEYEPLMRAWAAHFTCIAPDTPGFGQSDPLPGEEATIDDFAEALLGFVDALGLVKIGAYGFHSGGVILMAALKRRPDLFSGLAVGAYGVWSAEEMAIFDRSYLPPFRPQPFGEHLTWAWHRFVEQHWYFPWFDTRDAARLKAPGIDVAKVDAEIREILDSGDAYRVGYGAVLRAPRALPPADADMPPVLITAYDADPLQAHLARLGAMPEGWEARPVATAADQQAASLAFLQAHLAPAPGSLPEAGDAGFIPVEAAGFAGLIHWRGRREAGTVTLPAPGGAAELIAGDTLALDLPGHGLSDDWPHDATPALDDWAAVAVAAIERLDVEPGEVVGEGLSALLAPLVAAKLGAAAGGVDVALPRPEDAERWRAEGLPDLTPDRFGSHLARGWAMARAEAAFWPWFAPARETAIPLADGALDLERLALRHRALIRARAGRRLLEGLLAADREAVVASAPRGRWEVPAWAEGRADVWRPDGGGMTSS